VAARGELNRRGERKRDENVMINGIIEEREREIFGIWRVQTQTGGR